MTTWFLNWLNWFLCCKRQILGIVIVTTAGEDWISMRPQPEMELKVGYETHVSDIIFVRTLIDMMHECPNRNLNANPRPNCNQNIFLTLTQKTKSQRAFWNDEDRPKCPHSSGSNKVHTTIERYVHTHTFQGAKLPSVQVARMILVWHTVVGGQKKYVRKL